MDRHVRRRKRRRGGWVREAGEIGNRKYLCSGQTSFDPKPGSCPANSQSMLESGQETPILVRRDVDRLVLVHGLHRLEACKALGEETILGYIVQAQKH